MTPTIIFLLLVLVLLYIGYFFVLPILSASNYSTNEDLDVLSTELYQSKLAELKTDLSAGTIDESEFKSAETELKLQLLSEADVNPDKVFTSPEARRYRTLLLVVLAMPTFAGLMYLWVGHPGAFQKTQSSNSNPHAGMSRPAPKTPATAQAATKKTSPVMPHASAKVIAQLEAKLKLDPRDINSLFALAYNYQRRKEFAKSAAMFKRILAFYPKSRYKGIGFATFAANYANVLASSQNNSLEGEPKRLIFLGLAAYPEHHMSLHLAGTYYFNKGDYKGAIKFWKKLHKLLLEKQPAYASGIMSSIKEAESKLALGTGKPASTMDKSATMPAATPTVAQSTPPAFAITGTVKIDPALKFTPAATHYLFLSTKRPSGPPRPIAALKLSNISYPYKFILGDKHQIIPTGKSMKDMLPLVLTARITTSGNVMDRTGSVVGSITITAGTSNNVVITINKR